MTRWRLVFTSAVLLACVSCSEDDTCQGDQKYLGVDIRGVPGSDIVSVVLVQGERVNEITEHCEARADGVVCRGHQVGMTHQLPLEVRVATAATTHLQTVTLRKDGCDVAPDPIVIELQ